MDREELDRRLDRAVVARRQLRRATLALAQLGRELLASRRTDGDAEDAASVDQALGSQLDRGLVDDAVARLTTELPDHDVAARAARLPTR